MWCNGSRKRESVYPYFRIFQRDDTLRAVFSVCYLTLQYLSVSMKLIVLTGH